MKQNEGKGVMATKKQLEKENQSLTTKLRAALRQQVHLETRVTALDLMVADRNQQLEVEVAHKKAALDHHDGFKEGIDHGMVLYERYIKKPVDNAWAMLGSTAAIMLGRDR